MVAVALTPGSGVFSSDLRPRQPTLDGFNKVFTQDHFYLEHFWQQMWNSLFIGVVTSAAVLAIGTMTSFAIGTIRIRGSSLLRSEEHTSELQSLMRISYAVFCLKKKKNKKTNQNTTKE